jgi:hypothetical protein
MVVFWDVAPCSLVENDPTFQRYLLKLSSGPLKRRSISTRLNGPEDSHLQTRHHENLNLNKKRVFPIPQDASELSPRTWPRRVTATQWVRALLNCPQTNETQVLMFAMTCWSCLPKVMRYQLFRIHLSSVKPRRGDTAQAGFLRTGVLLWLEFRFNNIRYLYTLLVNGPHISNRTQLLILTYNVSRLYRAINTRGTHDYRI